MSLFSLLPILAGWLGFVWIARDLAARGAISRDWRVGFILACVGGGTALVAITEVSSLPRMLNAPGLTALWILVDVAVWGAVLGLCRRRGGSTWSPIKPALHGREVMRAAASCVKDNALSTAVIASLVLVLGGIALFTPTTNWDSLTYHLPRVFHWIQQQSLEHYPTSIERQLEMGPWPAFVQSHLLLLGKTDLFVNMPQWVAMIGCLIVVTLITDRLWAGPIEGSRVKFFAALLLVTMGTGIVQSITPQTDYVTTFWLACLLALILEIHFDPHNRWLYPGAALACGLGVLTKATMILYAAPVLAVFVAIVIMRAGIRQATVRLALFAFLVIAVNAPHALRNYQLYGSPLGSHVLKEATTNPRLTAGGAMSTLIRNAALHTGTGIRPLTTGLNRTLNWLHSFTGCELNDPETSFGLGQFEFYDNLVIFDSYAGNPYHIALVVIALVVSIKRGGQPVLPVVYAAALVCSLLLICLFLRWQRWNCRLHFPCLALLTPFIAVVIGPRLRRMWLNVISAGLAAFAFVVILNNVSRPFLNPGFRELPRVQQMLAIHAPQLHEQMSKVVSEVIASGCRNVGLKYGIDDPEYPFWLLFLGHGLSGRIDHALVENPSGSIPVPVQPDVIISVFEGPLPSSLTNAYPVSTTIDSYTLYWSVATAERRPDLRRKLQPAEGSRSSDALQSR